MRKFQNKYRISSSRLRNWDYGSPGMYFITICTKNRELYFGDVVNGEMALSETGLAARSEWIKTPELRPDMKIELDEFVVMPNHFHGLILIGENQYNTHAASKNQFRPQSKNLASVIRGYKSSVTTFARENNIEFDWQPRYHDHIIRSEMELNRVRQYILDNPMKWERDRNNVENLMM